MTEGWVSREIRSTRANKGALAQDLPFDAAVKGALPFDRAQDLGAQDFRSTRP